MAKSELQLLERSKDQIAAERRPIVMKLGGTSVGGARAIETSSRIIEPYYHNKTPLVLVVSAMRGVTDNLVRACNYAEQSRSQDLELHLWDIVYKHQEVVSNLNLSASLHQKVTHQMDELFLELFAECTTTAAMTDARKAKTLTFGERSNSHIVTAQLMNRGIISEAVDAREVIETNDNYLDAVPNLEKTKIYAERKIRPLLDNDVVPVVTGFIGATKDNHTTTLGRGGSDYTASILGRVLNAKEVWIWTDVDGVYSADPRNNPEAKILSELTYATADRMAKAGARVLYPKTVEPLEDTDITLRVKNTFNSTFIGTKISS